jgi:hypothetical protein
MIVTRGWCAGGEIQQRSNRNTSGKDTDSRGEVNRLFHGLERRHDRLKEGAATELEEFGFMVNVNGV